LFLSKVLTTAVSDLRVAGYRFNQVKVTLEPSINAIEELRPLMRDSIDTVAPYYSAPGCAEFPFNSSGVRIRAQCRHLATVVTITGAIDVVNVDPVTERCKRFILPDKALVLDLAGVDSLAAQAIRLLYRIDDDCRAAGLEWALITSPAVTRLLRVADDPARFPIVESVHEALHYFADAASARRRQLLPLLHKTA
jgi:anti-anti-sigma factor